MANEFKTKEGKDPTWTDVASHLKEEAIKAIDDREAKKLEWLKRPRRLPKKMIRNSLIILTRIVDEDLDDLYKSNKLNLH